MRVHRSVKARHAILFALLAGACAALGAQPRDGGAASQPPIMIERQGAFAAGGTAMPETCGM